MEGGLDVAMVSIRRRKLKGRCNGRNSSLVSLLSIPNGNVFDNPGQSRRPSSVHYVPSVPLNQPVEVKERTDTIASRPAKRQKIHAQIDPPVKRQKIHAQIDPENPMEVHAYLMKLKEDKKLELVPSQRSEEMSVKEWMEKCFPYIFRVFPQSPKVFLQFSDESKQKEFLYSHYWLFLFEVRNIVLMDYRVSPDYVESLGKVIKTLEMQGFDCRFMRSEMLVVGYMMKKRQEITLAERNMIAKRTINLEKELQDLTRKKGNEAEFSSRGKETEDIKLDIEMLQKQMDKMQEDKHKGEGEPNKLPYASLEEEYVEVILDRHKKMLACKEEEGKRLDQVLDKISQLHQNKSALSKF
ncbi:conserved hypothetical protein [Ricinus communis]|uniref:Uncharacterized protein n=1 Tax=Ricinus communis TaxID=3988 RepID=B9T7Y9_RICCO|nr:conserved hypothetical protein [Ricinus communis]